MDKFLEFFSQRTTSQKILITIAGALIFLFFLAVVYILTTPPQPKSNLTKDNNSKAQTPTLATINTQPTSPVLKAYQDKYYQISYPDNLIIEPGIIGNDPEQTSLLIHPPTNSSGNTEYNIEIEALSSKVSSISAILAVFTALGYQKGNITVSNGLPAYIFKGQTEIQSRTLQEIAVFLEDKGRIFKLQLTYNNLNVDPRIELVFLRILPTFRLNTQ